MDLRPFLTALTLPTDDDLAFVIMYEWSRQWAAHTLANEDFR